MPTVPKAKSDSDIDHSGFDIDNFDFVPETVKDSFRQPPETKVATAAGQNPTRMEQTIQVLKKELTEQYGDAKEKFGELSKWAQSNPVLAGSTVLGTAAIGALLALALSGGKRKARGSRAQRLIDRFEKRRLGNELEDAEFDAEFTEFLAALLDDAE